MIDKTLSPEAARRFYDRLGRLYDVAEFYESKAKRSAFERLALRPGEWALNVGVGTGHELGRLLADVGPQGCVVGLDLSRTMLRLSRERYGAPVVQADAGRLPFAPERFDALYCAYTLDLIGLATLPGVLHEFRRVLKRGGRAVVVTLTEGVNLPSKAFVGMWKAAYTVSPIACGGCRPLQLSDMSQDAGFTDVSREVVVQFGVPSEVLALVR